MEVKDAYNVWADQYDTNENKTRDLEAVDKAGIPRILTLLFRKTAS